MKLVGNNRAIRSPEFHKRQRRLAAAKLSGLALIVLLLIAAPIYALRHERFRISRVEARGNAVTSTEEVAQVVTRELSGSYLWLLPKSNALLVSEGSVEEALLREIPRIASADVSIEGGRTLVASVSEREPYALYCADAQDISDSSHCYFLDETGRIFSEAPEFSGSVYMIYSSEPALAEPLRSEWAGHAEFAEIGRFLVSLGEFGLSPKVLVKKESEYALLLGSGAELRWKSGQDLERLASDLGAFMRDAELKPAAFGNLLYIDLRFENKVFYKFRDE